MKPKSFPSRLFYRNTPTPDETGRSKFQQHVDSVDQQEEGSAAHSGKSHRDVHFAFLPERYEPLMEEAEVSAKEEKKKRKKEKYKKVKKNVGKALRSSWKYLMLGLYNFSMSYTTPIAMAATFVPDFHPSRNRD
ncbi:required for drug-induced death protein 1-like [Genypterus blacodes]|uniref:required for drug-induced death protein 1-like n=1 Tax=Genypterus blacodes TaxID=154954 RepID=UPI003F765234